jgi:GNAT superfamily N-acetyltransferase
MIESRVCVRAANTSDACALADVHAEAWRTAYQGLIPHTHLRNMIARRDSLWWERVIVKGGVLVLEFEGVAQGYATYGPSRLSYRARGEIFELYVSPVFQGGGLGKRLFMTARAAARRIAGDGLIVWALEDNALARQFYERMGGEPVYRSNEWFGQVKLPKVAYLWRG